MSNFLTQKLVNRYAKLRALKNLLDKWLDERRDGIRAALVGGENCPDKGPFLLSLSEPVEKPVSWKEEFILWLRADGRSEDDIAYQLRQIADKPRESESRILCKANPNYRRAFPIVLPK